MFHSPVEDRHGRVQKLVDRRPDDHNDSLRTLQHRRVRAELESIGLKYLMQEFSGTGLEERHLAPGNPLQGRFADVKDANAQACGRER